MLDPEEPGDKFDKKPGKKGFMSKAKGMFKKGKFWGRSKSNKEKVPDERDEPVQDDVSWLVQDDVAITARPDLVITIPEEPPATVTSDQTAPEESEPTKKKSFVSKAKGMFKWKSKKESETDPESGKAIPDGKSSKSAKKGKGYLSKAKGMFSKAKKKGESAVGLRKKEEEEEEGCKIGCMSNLSWKNRIWGFGISYGLGMLCQAMGMVFILTPPPLFSVMLFAVFYTIGNILALGSGLFLTGIRRQWQLIKAYGRWICILVYVGLMGFTLYYIFRDWTKPGLIEVTETSRSEAKGSPNIIIVILLVIGQFLASFWYMLSYIPFGRALVKKCLGKAVDT